MNFDLADFFPSIHFGRVRGLFQSKPYNLPAEASQTLAQICCHEAVLPAGAPTSPTVANMICARMDSELGKLARQYNCRYTRYADDITISSQAYSLHKGIAKRDPGTRRWEIGDEVASVVSTNGFKINSSKTRVLFPHHRQEVTGLVINSRLNVKRLFIRQVRAMLHAWGKWGEEAAKAEFYSKYDRKQRLRKKPDFKRVVRGKIEFIGFIRGRDDLIYMNLMGRYSTLDHTARMRQITITAAASDAVVQQAVWLIEGDENDEKPRQGTAFALEGYDLITAAHNLIGTRHVSRPHVDGKKFKFAVIKKDDHRDVAQIRIAGEVPIQFSVGRPEGLRQGTPITLLGFPDYHVGAHPQLARGPITSERTYSGVRHLVIAPDIIRGNSGGPILDEENRVIGVAIKGQGTPAAFSEHDALSSFVAIDSLAHMK